MFLERSKRPVFLDVVLTFLFGYNNIIQNVLITFQFFVILML